MPRVLVVDDLEANLYLLESLLKGYDYEVQRAQNGHQALELARQSPPDLVISDILMPVMDGFALCREWRKDERLRDVPFVFYTATYTDPKDEILAMDLGADRFVVKPVEPGAFIEIIRDVLRQHRWGGIAPGLAPPKPEEVYLRQYNEVLVRKLQDKLEEVNSVNAALKESHAKLDEVLIQAVHALASALAQRHDYMAPHQKRCADLAAAIAKRMGASSQEIDAVRVAALLHDIGKVAVPAEVLAKPGALTDPEWALVRRHVEVGCQIIGQIDFPWPVADLVRQHHERLDGSGYPEGLKGVQILPGSRIIAVADVVEAMMSRRPYRPAFPLQQTLDEILQNRSRLYDANVAETLSQIAAEKAFAW